MNIVKHISYGNTVKLNVNLQLTGKPYIFHGVQEDTGSWRRKLKIALFGELSLEEAIDLSRDRQILDWLN
jgi:hypothetical protein